VPASYSDNLNRSLTLQGAFCPANLNALHRNDIPPQMEHAFHVKPYHGSDRTSTFVTCPASLKFFRPTHWVFSVWSVLAMSCRCYDFTHIQPEIGEPTSPDPFARYFASRSANVRTKASSALSPTRAGAADSLPESPEFPVFGK